jgi:hypothetical protein
MLLENTELGKNKYYSSKHNKRKYKKVMTQRQRKESQKKRPVILW